MLAWTVSRPLLADPPSSSSAAPTAAADDSSDPDAEAALKKGLDLERKKNWAGAIDAYQTAHERWPSRKDFKDRQRLCEIHYRLVRRYQDQSFRNVLLRLPRDRALELYDEVLERISSYYVDAVPLEPLVRWGFDNLEVALRDPTFLKPNAGEPNAEAVNSLRQNLGRRREQLQDRSTIPDRAAARNEVLAACELASSTLHIAPAAVVLEFAYGACDALDDYTSYLTPDKLEDLYAMIDGNFVGLGIELKIDREGLHIVGVIRGGPAFDAGLKVGDKITHISGNPVRGQSLDEAASKLQGAEGTELDIVVLHPDGKSTPYRMTRRHVEVESVTQARIVEPADGVGYIQLAGFQKSSSEELNRAIITLQRAGMKTLVLDLRGNPGGLLNVAVEIAELFISRGVIVSTRGRAPGQSQVYQAQGRAVWPMPMLVLIDHDSASASEILAGALKEHGRAVVIGEKSYGKGSVQSIFALRSAPAGLKLTTAKFYSPFNRSYSEQGVEPDVAVELRRKPAADSDGKKVAVVPESAFGDPEKDIVMQHAIREARKRKSAAR
jgi:carboxyl-terminal processing protease